MSPRMATWQPQHLGSHVISPGGVSRTRTHACFLLAKARSRCMFRSDVVFQLDRGDVLPLLKPPPSVRLASLATIMILTPAMWKTGTGLHRARQHTPTERRRRQESSWPSKRLVSVSHSLFLLFFPLSHTVRPQTDPSPICCMKDHTVPVSNQTTLSGARPLLCPPTHTSMATRRASSTRQRRHSGSSLVGRPCCRRGPWWPSCPPTGGGDGAGCGSLSGCQRHTCAG